MSAIKERWIFVAIGGLVVVVFAVVATSRIELTEGQATKVHLEGVSEAQLREKGISLKAPSPDDQATLGAEAATRIARLAHNNAQAKDVALARLIVEDTEPPINALVWAIAFDPATVVAETYGGPIFSEWAKENPGSSIGDPRVIYAVSFIDAQTGEELRYVSKARIPVVTPNEN